MVTLKEKDALKKDAIICIWAAFGMLVFGALTALLFNFKQASIFLLMALMVINLAHARYPEPRPKVPIRLVFPNNRFLRWTFYSLSLFLVAYGVWQLWEFSSEILFSG